MIDVDHQLLPDDITLPLMWLGLLFNLGGTYVSLQDAVIGAMAGYLILWSIYWLFKLLTGKEGMGYGDFKLLAALGAWLGWQALPMIILLSSLVGAVCGIALMVIKRRGKEIPIPLAPTWPWPAGSPCCGAMRLWRATWARRDLTDGLDRGHHRRHWQRQVRRHRAL